MFLWLYQNIHCGNLKELSQGDNSFEYPQCMLFVEQKRNILEVWKLSPFSGDLQRMAGVCCRLLTLIMDLFIDTG